jgi:hypothetical protein
MAVFVYSLGALVSVFCMALLLRGWITSRTRLLLWIALCFAFLSLSNILLLIDLFIVPDKDLSLLRDAIALAGVGLLIFGLVWDTGRNR